MNKFLLGCVWSGFLILVLCSPAFAFHPLITDDAGTLGKGKFQLEVNGGYGEDKDEAATTQTTRISTSLSYGLLDSIDLIVTLPYERYRVEDSGNTLSENGITDMSLELKWRFYEKNGLSLALKPGLTFPTGDEDKGLGTGRRTYHLFFIGTKEIHPWAFHLNLGYIRNENKFDENKDLWHASLASTFEVIKDLKIVGNIGLERSADRDTSTPTAFILGGVIYSLWENFDLDFGVKSGLTEPEEDYTILMGITWRF